MIALLLAVQASASELRVMERVRVFAESEPVSLTLVPAGPGSAAATLVRCGPGGETKLGEARMEGGGGEGKLFFRGLPRGYYELRRPGGAASAFIVTFDPEKRPRVEPDRARIATDGAIAWLVKPEDFEAVSRLMALAGVAWVRDRLSWAEVQPARGEFRPGRYERAARVQQSAGLSVVTVFHDTPAWARKDGNRKGFPEALDGAFAFGKSLAGHFRGLLRAYEVWNEADIEVFAVETADRYAAFLKAASLGLKAGDPRALVLMNSFATQAQGFGEVLFENEIGAYVDAYNYHLYQPPDRHPSVARWHFALAERFGLRGLPFWVTEAGIRLPDAGGRLAEADRWKQADFVAKSYARSLMTGVDRHFFFIFPYYKEGKINFGLLDRDWGPTPGLAALATMSYALGRADPLGEGLPGGRGVTALFFDAGPWRTTVLWAPEAGEVEVKTGDPAARVLSLTGEEIPFQGGRVRVGPSPVYVLAKDLAPAATATRPALPPRPPAPGLPEVVLRISLPRATASFRKQLYVLPADSATPAEVEVWNLGVLPFRGKVRLSCEAPFRIEPGEAEVEVPPMEAARVSVVLCPPAEGGAAVVRVEARAESAGRTSSAARVRVGLEPRRAAYLTVEPFPLDPKDWTPGIAGGGEVKLTSGGGGSLRVEALFRGGGDRWTYPSLVFRPPRDLSRFEAIRLRLRVIRPTEGLVVRVQLVEPGGVHYLTEEGLRPRPGEVVEWVAPFREFGHGGFSAPDPNGRLDLDRVERLLVGFNQEGPQAAVEFLSIEAVGMGRPK